MNKARKRNKKRRGCQEWATQSYNQPQIKKERKIHRMKKDKNSRGKTVKEKRSKLEKLARNKTRWGRTFLHQHESLCIYLVAG